MADLLECLIQIKALAETPTRLERLIAGHHLSPTAREMGPPIAAVLQQLQTREHAYAIALGLAAPTEGESRDPGRRLQRFVTSRQATLAALDACSAGDLARHVAWPGRGHTTVADLVAIMLASDTDLVSDLRESIRTGDTSLAVRKRRCPALVYSAREPRTDR